MESKPVEDLNLRDGGALHKLIDRKDSPQDVYTVHATFSESCRELYPQHVTAKTIIKR